MPYPEAEAEAEAEAGTEAGIEAELVKGVVAGGLAREALVGVLPHSAPIPALASLPMAVDAVISGPWARARRTPHPTPLLAASAEDLDTEAAARAVAVGGASVLVPLPSHAEDWSGKSPARTAAVPSLGAWRGRALMAISESVWALAEPTRCKCEKFEAQRADPVPEEDILVCGR